MEQVPESTRRPLYRPLSTRSSTRLVILEPGKFDDQIHGQLREVVVDAGKSEPEHEALSYAWGSSEAMHTVCIDGHFVTIRNNLYNALRKLGCPDKVRPIRVDALSILQTDMAEKAQQVAMISSIFRGATRVVAWVGEHADFSQYIFGEASLEEARGDAEFQQQESRLQMTHRGRHDSLSIFTPFKHIELGTTLSSPSHRSNRDCDLKLPCGRLFQTRLLHAALAGAGNRSCEAY